MRVLHRDLHRDFFAKIAAGTKRTEYRDFSPHWRNRLEGKKYDVIQFCNEYARNAPEMLVEFRSIRRYRIGRGGYHSITLG